MITLHSNGKKQRFIKKDNNKLGKRKLLPIKNSKEYVFITKRKHEANLVIPYNWLPKGISRILNGEKIIKNITNRDYWVTYAEMLYLIVIYNVYNKVYEFLGYELEPTLEENEDMFYNRVTLNFEENYLKEFIDVVYKDYNNIPKSKNGNGWKYNVNV